jgi:hypothetical protein
VTTPLDRVGQLERIADVLGCGEQPSPDDAAWLADGLLRYSQEAATGMTLEDALGLAPTVPGEEHWTTTQRRRRRNAVIHAIRSRPLFADLKIPEAAREIAALGSRYRQTGRAIKSTVDPETEKLIADALCTGLPFPGPKQIANILEIK